MQSRKLIELDPGFDYGYYVLGLALSFSGEHEEAIAALSQCTELSPDEDYALAALAFTHARGGNRGKALGLVVEVGESLPVEIAWVHGALGDVDRAFEYLERPYEADPFSLRLVNVDPMADSLRDDPRFAELLRRLELE